MKKSVTISLFLIFAFSISILVGRGFRVSKVPHGTKFSCNTCHTSGGGTPRNPFGLDVEARVTPGGAETFWGPELASLDSDGDGFTNGEELQDPTGSWIEGTALPGDPALVTHPGDSSDHPSVTTIAENNTRNDIYQLRQNYPNPFNPSTTIAFSIPTSTNVSINIYNSLGQKIKELTNNIYNQGQHTLVWNSRNDAGNQVSSGIYIYRIIANDFNQTRRMLLIK